MTVDERRARLGQRHCLAPKARTDDVVAMVDSLVALHSTDPATVFLSAAARMRNPSVTPLEQALYDDRLLVRTLCMRRTMFVLPVEMVPVVQAACTDALVAGERRRTMGMLQQAGIANPDRHLRMLEKATLAAIEERAEATGAELSKLVPALGQKVLVGQGTKWEGSISMTTRVLFLLSTEQRLVRGRPRGAGRAASTGGRPCPPGCPRRPPGRPPT
jgi:hypothetical protein